jgi:hypothetical protein
MDTRSFYKTLPALQKNYQTFKMLIKKSIALILLLTITLLSTQDAEGRQVSERIKQISSTAKPICDFDEVPYCYLFKAIVDIDSGYLRVWKSDEKGNDYVAGRLEKGEVIHIRTVFKYKGVLRGGITQLTKNCMSSGCFGSVDLRYLR